jgi:hypothetical protein
MTPQAQTNFAVRAAPALFVLLWSTGFISTKMALSARAFSSEVDTGSLRQRHKPKKPLRLKRA